MENHQIYDVVIIGGGPGAVAAGVYAARKQLRTVFIADQIGGQSTVSDGIANWIGDKLVSGADLSLRLRAHLEEYSDDLTLALPDKATAVLKNSDGTFAVSTQKDNYMSKSVIVATGGRHRTLDVPGEAAFTGRGVAYCATCDAPFFKGKNVAVVGGGNSALESVVDLMPYARHITLLVRGDELHGDPITQQKVLGSEQVTVIYMAQTKEISGEKMVSGLQYEDLRSGESKDLSVGGVFVEIGSVPNSELVGDLVHKNEYGEIMIDHRTCSTSEPGIFAAGDVTDELYKQNNIAVGDAIKALLSANDYVKKN